MKPKAHKKLITIPIELLRKLQSAAKQNRRHVTQELLLRVEQSFQDSPVEYRGQRIGNG